MTVLVVVADSVTEVVNRIQVPKLFAGLISHVTKDLDLYPAINKIGRASQESQNGSCQLKNMTRGPLPRFAVLLTSQFIFKTEVKSLF